MAHNRNHSFTGNTDHDFTGLSAGEMLIFNGTNIISTGSTGGATGIYDGNGTIPTTTVATLTDTLAFSGGSVTIQGVGNTSSTDTLLLKDSDGTTTMVVEDGGNVGIGTAAPTAKLDILAAPFESPFRAEGSAGDVVSINAQGNLGIGTSNAGAKLQMDVVSGTNQLRMLNGGSIRAELIAGNVGALQLYDGTATRDIYLPSTFQGYYYPSLVFGNRGEISGSAAAQVKIKGASGASSPLYLESSNGLHSWIFNNQGNAGFGTILPTAKLHVSGSTNLDGSVKLSSLTTTPAAGYVLQSVDADGNADWVNVNTLVTGVTTDLNGLSDVTTGLPLTPTLADDGKILFYDFDATQWVTDDSVTHGTVVINAKKSTAGTIAKGTPVYLVGFDSDLHTVEAANAGSSTTMPVIGFAGETLDDTNSNHIISFGKITGIDTTSTGPLANGETWAINDALYVDSVTGELTNVRPTGATTEIQRVAKVLRVDASGGQLFIFNTARTAGLPNLSQDNVWLGNSDNQPIEATKTSLGIYAGSGTIPTTTVATLTDTLAFSGGSVTIQGVGNTSSTDTLLLKDSDGTTTMVVEDGGNVGIGTAAPTAKLHVQGSGSSPATTPLLVENSIGGSTGTAMKVRDDLTIGFGSDIIDPFTKIHAKYSGDVVYRFESTNNYSQVHVKGAGNIGGDIGFYAYDGADLRASLVGSGQNFGALNLYDNLNVRKVFITPQGNAYSYFQGAGFIFGDTSALAGPTSSLQSKALATVSALKLENPNGTSQSIFEFGNFGFTGIGTVSPTAKLHVDGSVRLSSLTTTPAAGYVLQSVDANGNADWVNVNTLVSGGTSGTVAGTTNNIAKFTASDTVGDSQVTDDGTTVSINNASPDSAYTLYISGNTKIIGSFEADSKSFDIEHPSDPEKRLRYGSLEGPEYGVYVRGKVDGGNEIVLPDYWKDLIHEDSITVQITPSGRFQGLYVGETSPERIEVLGDDSPQFYYVVYGERKDIDKITIEY